MEYYMISFSISSTWRDTGDFGIKRLLRKLWINDREIFGKVGLRIRNISVRTDMIGIQIWINFSTFPVLRDKAF